jgi:hypothetical protein
MKRSTYILLILVLIFALYIFFFERKSKSTKEIEEKSDNLFSEFIDDASEISRVGFEDFKIVKEKDNYILKEPFYDPADTNSVKGFIETFKEAKAERIIKEKVDLKDLGLLEPRIKITFKSKDKEKTLKIGDVPPYGKGAYFISDNRIGVLSDLTIETVKRGINNFREKELCAPLNVDEVKVLSYYKNGSLELSFERKGDEWLVSHPFKDIADARKTISLIEDVVLWPIMEFEKGENTEDYELSKGNEKFVLTTLDGKETTITLGKLKDEQKKFYYAKVSSRNGIFVVSKNSVRNIDANKNIFRSLMVFDKSFEKYDEIVVKKEKEIIFKNKDKNFVCSDKAIDENSAKTFIFSLTSLEGDNYLEGFEAKEKYAEVELKGKDETKNVSFYEEGEQLVSQIQGRSGFIKLSKDSSERVKGAFSVIFSKAK